MGSVPGIAICVAILCLPGGAACCWLGMRMLRGKSLGYIAGNASDYHDNPDGIEQKELGGIIGAIVLVAGILLLACVPLCFLFG